MVSRQPHAMRRWFLIMEEEAAAALNILLPQKGKQKLKREAWFALVSEDCDRKKRNRKQTPIFISVSTEDRVMRRDPQGEGCSVMQNG